MDVLTQTIAPALILVLAATGNPNCFEARSGVLRSAVVAAMRFSC